MQFSPFVVETGAGHVAGRRIGSGPPVLLIHGLPGRGAVWDGVAQRLAPAHDVVVPDLLGFGGSARPTALDALHASAQADALGHVLDALGLRDVCVVGHDFGGPVALLLHRRQTAAFARLALLATNTFTDTPVPFPLSLTTARVIGGAARAVLFSALAQAAMLRAGTGRPRLRLDRRTYLGDRSQQRSIRTIFAGSLAELPRLYTPVEEELARVEVPTLVGWGERDPFFTVAQGERAAAAIRGARFRLYVGAGHFLPEERPDELAADIAGLVAGGSSSASTAS
jgi:pimeloyl-ACP methyl ester carboxylesterase